MKEKEVEWGAWSTFFAGVNVWKSELPGCQKAQITDVIADCYQLGFSLLKPGESEIMERELSGALVNLASAGSSWMFLVMNQLHLGL